MTQVDFDAMIARAQLLAEHEKLPLTKEDWELARFERDALRGFWSMLWAQLTGSA